MHAAFFGFPFHSLLRNSHSRITPCFFRATLNPKNNRGSLPSQITKWCCPGWKRPRRSLAALRASVKALGFRVSRAAHVSFVPPDVPRLVKQAGGGSFSVLFAVTRKALAPNMAVLSSRKLRRADHVLGRVMVMLSFVARACFGPLCSGCEDVHAGDREPL